MAVDRAVLAAELVLSAQRVITAAEGATVAAGQWPAQVVLGHLMMNDTDNWGPRIALMANAARTAQPPPVFAWYEPDGDQVAARFTHLTVAEAGAGLLAARTALLRQVRELAPADWEATAQHEVFGMLDLRDVLLALLAHDEEHRGGLLFGPDVSLGL